VEETAFTHKSNIMGSRKVPGRLWAFRNASNPVGFLTQLIPIGTRRHLQLGPQTVYQKLTEAFQFWDASWEMVLCNWPVRLIYELVMQTSDIHIIFPFLTKELKKMPFLQDILIDVFSQLIPNTEQTQCLAESDEYLELLEDAILSNSELEEDPSDSESVSLDLRPSNFYTPLILSSYSSVFASEISIKITPTSSKEVCLSMWRLVRVCLELACLTWYREDLRLISRVLKTTDRVLFGGTCHSTCWVSNQIWRVMKYKYPLISRPTQS
jgi:hypothetical protein